MQLFALFDKPDFYYDDNHKLIEIQSENDVLDLDQGCRQTLMTVIVHDDTCLSI